MQPDDGLAAGPELPAAIAAACPDGHRQRKRRSHHGGGLHATFFVASIRSALPTAAASSQTAALRSTDWSRTAGTARALAAEAGWRSASPQLRFPCSCGGASR
jgi:hypothetical protein